MSEATERHYTPKEIAELWQVDPCTVRRLIQDEPGVLKLGNAGSRRSKRAYITLRVPQSVLERLHSRRTK